jgi:quercetin dioxygenase-like cupin family protein
MPTSERIPIVLQPGAGRSYAMGPLTAVFKADAEETANGYSISEWWFEPHTKGPGPHSHPEDDVFFVLQGTMSFLVGDRWSDAPAGSFVLVPGGVRHDYENRSAERAGVLNFFSGPFEPAMNSIVEWFTKHPIGDTRS